MVARGGRGIALHRHGHGAKIYNSHANYCEAYVYGVRVADSDVALREMANALAGVETAADMQVEAQLKSVFADVD